MTQIVTVDVSVTQAPAPSTLQRTGAFISQGATTTAEGSLSLLTEFSDLTPLLVAPAAITSLAWASNVATATTAAPHGFTVSSTVSLTIAGATPAGYNGTFTCTITGASTFTYPLTGNPGSETVPGTYIPANVAELTAMATTFFAQGSLSVYVLELGIGTATQGVAALGAFITANPNTVYSYLVPKEWDGNSAFLSFILNYDSLTSKTYFHVTTTTGTYTDYTALMKCVLTTIQAPAAPSTEFSAAAQFWVTLNWAPGTVNQVTPLAYAIVQGVTPYPLVGNAALLATLKAAHVGVIGTGAEGGLSNTILLYGQTMDGRQFNYWYSVDWAQINLDLTLSNEIINGSNNPLAPLYYNQAGINRLQARAQQTLNNGVTFGLINGTPKVDAIPFYTYTQENESDYRDGVYNGLSATIVPQTGFLSITFYLNVSDFPAP